MDITYLPSPATPVICEREEDSRDESEDIIGPDVEDSTESRAIQAGFEETEAEATTRHPGFGFQIGGVCCDSPGVGGGIHDSELRSGRPANTLSVETSPMRSIGMSADDTYLHKC